MTAGLSPPAVVYSSPPLSDKGTRVASRTLAELMALPAELLRPGTRQAAARTLIKRHAKLTYMDEQRPRIVTDLG